MPDPLDAVSPLDGRYAGRTRPLRHYVSEGALIRARTRVEVEYLLALAEVEEVPLELSATQRDHAREVYTTFDDEDARLVKQIETEGYGPYAATNHDVKAVEYFLRERLPDLTHPWIHFGLTSEDTTNLAYRLLLREAVTAEVRPTLESIEGELRDLAREHKTLPMLAHTHGQPATPTTFGKEMAVFVNRLRDSIGRIDTATNGLQGKFGGASGTFAAHQVALPTVDWREFGQTFVESFDLEYVPVSTQINPGDDLASLFDALRGANQCLIDLDRDAWLYISNRYLGQRATAGETGSSTMPHKINPIDFENAEGNLSKANADLRFLSEWITTSRLQRDLTDSTVKRNIGTALAHCLLGYQKTGDGLSSIVPNPERMEEDLASSPAVLGEAVQTVLRREGQADAYEHVKELTRGESLTLEEFRSSLEELDIDPDIQEELRSLEPSDYIGLAAELVESIDP